MTRLGKIKKTAEDYLNQYKSSNPASYAAAQQAIGGVLIVDGFIGIDNPFGDNKRSGIFGSLLGIVFGLVFFFFPAIFNSLTGTREMTAQTQATVESVRRDSSEDGGGSCSATAKYTVSGKEYTQNSSFSSGSLCSLSQGSTITINYNPNQPGAWGYDLKSLDTFMKIFQAVGVFIIIASFITFLIRLLSIYFGWKLLKSGRALAKTLPSGTDLDTLINEIKKNFATQLFNFGGVMQQPAQPSQGAVATPQPPLASPQQPQVPPPSPVSPPAAPQQPTTPPPQTPSSPPSPGSSEDPPRT